MKKCIGIVFLCAITFETLQAMEPQKQPPVVTLLAEDGTTKVSVPLNSALQSNTIKMHMEEFPDTEFPTAISKERLQLVAVVMNALEQHKMLKDKALFDTVAKILSQHIGTQKNRLRTYLTLLETANYLDFKFLYQLMIRELISIGQDKPKLALFIFNDLKRFPIIQKDFARWNYLITGAPVPPEIQKKFPDFGFTLRELLQYGRLNRTIDTVGHRFITRRLCASETIGFLDLSGLRLTDIDGLQEIPGIKACTGIYLYNNLLKELPLISPFAGLDKVKHLNLTNNALKRIPRDTFNNLPSLQQIILDHNQLVELPQGLFAGLSQLKVLSLNANQLKVLSANIFDDLIQLDSLELNRNRLEELPVGIFNGLVNLTSLDLNDNQFKTLSPSIFLPLMQLKWLFLYENQLSNENQEAIRAVLPNTYVVFGVKDAVKRLIKRVVNYFY